LAVEEVVVAGIAGRLAHYDLLAQALMALLAFSALVFCLRLIQSKS
jgi:hypothetical protein